MVQEFDVKQEMEEYFVLDAGRKITFLREDVDLKGSEFQN